MSTNPLSKEQIKEVLPTLPKGYRWYISSDETLFLVKKSSLAWFLDKPIFEASISPEWCTHRSEDNLLTRINTAAKRMLERLEEKKQKEALEGFYE